MVNVDLYSAIITKVSNALNTLVSVEKPGFQTLSKGLVVLLCSEVVRHWYCHVPGHWLSSGPWQESGPIWAFVVIPHQVDWLFDCWHLGSLDRCPQDVIQMTVTLLSGSASAAG